jgi:hypothetical protein
VKQTHGLNKDKVLAKTKVLQAEGSRVQGSENHFSVGCQELKFLMPNAEFFIFSSYSIVYPGWSLPVTSTGMLE